MPNQPFSVRTVLAFVALVALPAVAPTRAQAQFVATPAESAAVNRSLAVSRSSLQELSLPAQAGAAFAVPLMLDGAPVQLLLSPVSLRSADFQLLAQG
jgi:hypothetical protein